MDEVTKLLNNPTIKAGLRVFAPEISLGLDLAVTVISSLFGRGQRKPKVEHLYAAVDRELAKVIKELATTKSKPYRQELEIRAHTLLGIIFEWEKIYR